ncbi:MAG TPA: hypothetical protein VFY49_20435 [Myxococcota bacterium]|nr:hypothetical protein [Myxococcota bacterium]
MVQPSSDAGDPPRATSPDHGAAGKSPRALPRVQALIEKGRDRGAARDTSWWDGLLELLRAWTRPPILRHAIAALQRGNLEAAFALLREEVKVRPGQAESALLFWNAAVSCERPADASEAMARLVRSLAASDAGLEQAANHWTALVNAVPDAVVEIASLAKLVPLLRARSDAARGDAAKTEALALLVDTLRRCVDPAHGPLNPALALRLVEEARGIDPQVARAAAEIALTSSGLHQAKRAKLEELIASLERGEWPDATAAAVAPASAPVAAPAPAPAARAAAPAEPWVQAKTKPKAKPERAPKPAPAPAPRAKPAIPAEEKPAPGGRRTVALTQDEIEAASSRLAERMAARKAPAPEPVAAATAVDAPAPAPAPEPVLDARDVLEADDEPQEKDEPIAVLEPDDAVAILADDAVEAVLEATPVGDEPVAVLENTDPRFDDANAEEFEFGGAAAATGPGGELESADATLDEGDAPDFAFGSAAGDEEGDAEFELGADPDEVASDADFEIGTDADAALAASPETDFTADAPEATAVEPEAAPVDPEATYVAPAAQAEPAQDAEDAVPVEDEPAEDAPAPALRAIDILPVEIGEDGLVAYEVAQAQRTRVDYRAVEAIAAAEVTDLADEPILVALLVLRARPGRPRSALRMRCDTFDPASLFPDHSDAGQALRAMLSDLLERTRAIPLPSPDSALAIQPHRFESLTAFEEAVVARLPS